MATGQKLPRWHPFTFLVLKVFRSFERWILFCFALFVPFGPFVDRLSSLFFRLNVVLTATASVVVLSCLAAPSVEVALNADYPVTSGAAH